MKKSLSPQEVQIYKQRLLDMRSAVAETVERVEEHALKPWAEAAIEIGDGATEETGLNLELDGLAVQHELGQSAQDALDRMKAGLYGVCATCSTEIGRERLDLLPYAIQCVDCAGRENAMRN
jgi:DnaK suppressor protein